MEADLQSGMTADELNAAWTILTSEERLEAFNQLTPADASHFFEMLAAVDQAEVLQGLPQAERGKFLVLLPPDDLADVFQELDERAQAVVFKSLAPEALAEVKELAAYDFDDAGGIMTPDFAHILPDMTVDRAIVSLRLQLKENPETLRYIYVLERDSRLAGVVSFRVLFGAPSLGKVRDLMQKELVTVREDTDQEAVALQMRDHGLAAIPVVDALNRMKGIITSDDVITVMEEEATEDIQKLAAVAPTETDYVRASVGLLWRRRIGWLMILLIAGNFTALIMQRFEEILLSSVVLAFYVPLLMGAAGNTGTQSAMLVVRSLATGELKAQEWARVLFKELIVGTLLGLLLAAMLGVMGFVTNRGGIDVAIVLALTMVTVVIWANIVGASLPVMIRAIKLDPAVVSAPLVTTLVDLSGIVIYLTIAGWILS